MQRFLAMLVAKCKKQIWPKIDQPDSMTKGKGKKPTTAKMGVIVRLGGGHENWWLDEASTDVMGRRCPRFARNPRQGCSTWWSTWSISGSTVIE